VRWLFEILEEWPHDMRVRFLDFVTARKRMPRSIDAWAMPLRIRPMSGAEGDQ